MILKYFLKNVKNNKEMNIDPKNVFIQNCN